MCGMSSVWLQGEGRDSADEEVPPTWVFSCLALSKLADQCCFAVVLRSPEWAHGSAVPPPKPAGSSIWQVAPEEKWVFSDAQQLGVTKKAVSLRVCLSGRLVAEKVFQSFCLSGRLAWWIKSCSRQWKETAVCPSVLPCMLVAWVTCLCDKCAYKYVYIHVSICKKKKLNMYLYQKPCGQKKPFAFRRRYVKCWGGWEQVTLLPWANLNSLE